MSKMLPVLVIIGVLFTVFIFLFDLLNFKNFEIHAEKDCISSGQAKEIILNKKPNILLFSASAMSNTLKTKFPCIENVTYVKQFPTLTITITSNLPLAKIDDSWLYVNSNLVAKEGTTSASVPTLYASQSATIKPNQTISDKETLFALSIIKNLKDSDFTVSNVRILDPENIVVYNPQNAVAVFSSQIELNSQINSLQSVLAKSKIDATKIGKIDLRFDKPVIVFK